jgi:hypothetical protein
MRTAINLEAVFAVLVVLAASLRRAGPSSPGQPDSRRYLLLLLIIPIAFLWTLNIPFVSDDYSHIGYALRFTPERIREIFTLPAGDRFFRPLGYLSYAIDAHFFGHSTPLWHLSTLLFHFANSLLVYLIARQQKLARFFAAAAAVLFGIHGSRPEAVTWIACRFDLIATLFVLATLALFQTRRPLLYAAALVTTLLALISKESAYVLPVLLLLFTERDSWRNVAKRVGPFAILAGAVFLYRWHVLSGIGGYETAAHTPTIYNFNLIRTLNALFLRLWAMLFFPINWSEPAQWWLLAAIGLGAVGYLVIAWRGTRDRRTLAFLLFTFIAALPAQHLLLISLDLEKSRVLYLSSAGFALFLATVLQELRSPAWRIPVAAALMCFQAACLEHNLIVWRNVALVADRACDSVAASLQGNNKTVMVLDLPNVLRGVYFFHKGMPDCLEVGHGIDINRMREDHADVVFHWEPQADAVSRERKP